MEILRFKPLLKQTIWGGEKLKRLKHIDTPVNHIGESWELSGVEGSETVVDGGQYDGMKLNELVETLKGDLVGDDNYRRFGNEFPLLVKFIDASQDLSIQVHPDDEAARRQGKPHGKTEMWYALDCAPGARIYCGLNQQLTPETYKQRVAENRIIEALACHEVKAGDMFFIPGGRIHSIGAGCLVAEIQQTSDVTYRIYDYNRRDSEGNTRQLHTKEAAECIDYHVHDDYRMPYQPMANQGVPVVSCPFFTTAVYDLTEPMVLDYSELDSFVILTCVSGSGKIAQPGQTDMAFEAGQTVLLPATIKEVSVEGQIRFLETYI